MLEPDPVVRIFADNGFHFLGHLERHVVIILFAVSRIFVINGILHKHAVAAAIFLADDEDGNDRTLNLRAKYAGPSGVEAIFPKNGTKMPL